jgi:SAM-dependent methyltransferase
MSDHKLNVRDYNRYAWDHQVDMHNKWTIPVNSQIIKDARNGIFSVLLTETKSVPHDWFPPFKDLNLLALACGGGQQGPIFAALGSKVTIFDNSPQQLDRDRQVAAREGLIIRTVEGDMRNLSTFSDGEFDLVFNPVSTVFCPDVKPVWQESYRVLRPGGLLLAGYANPIYYMFGTHADEQQAMTVRFSIPYSDLKDMEQEELDLCIEEGIPLEFGHSLTDLIGGQIDVGFAITGFYEDICPDSHLSKYHPSYIATRAIKTWE